MEPILELSLNIKIRTLVVIKKIEAFKNRKRCLISVAAPGRNKQSALS
jgi:hypothetical protein